MFLAFFPHSLHGILSINDFRLQLCPLLINREYLPLQLLILFLVALQLRQVLLPHLLPLYHLLLLLCEQLPYLRLQPLLLPVQGAHLEL